MLSNQLTRLIQSEFVPQTLIQVEPNYPCTPEFETNQSFSAESKGEQVADVFGVEENPSKYAEGF